MTDCLFCGWQNHELLAESDLAFAIRDKYPVRPLHSLILPKRHVVEAFDLTPEEFFAIFALAKTVRDLIIAEDPTVGGFNFGSNSGAIGGQKIMHVHFHLIPRRANDTTPPPAS